MEAARHHAETRPAPEGLTVRALFANYWRHIEAQGLYEKHEPDGNAALFSMVAIRSSYGKLASTMEELVGALRVAGAIPKIQRSSASPPQQPTEPHGPRKLPVSYAGERHGRAGAREPRFVRNKRAHKRLARTGAGAPNRCRSAFQIARHWRRRGDDRTRTRALP